jgi:hypothetical protein
MAANDGADGGAGGYSLRTYPITGGQTLVYSVGAAGAGGTSGGAATAGGASSVSSGTLAITTMTANGGGLGAVAGTGGAGGTATGLGLGRERVNAGLGDDLGDAFSAQPAGLVDRAFGDKFVALGWVPVGRRLGHLLIIPLAVALVKTPVLIRIMYRPRRG